MTSIDPYTKIHKALRRDMFACLTTLGCLDFDDPSVVERARAQVASLLRDLHEHGENEDRFLHPVLVVHMPEHAARLADQHRALDHRLESLVERFAHDAFTGSAALLHAYRDLAEFIAAYLEHLASEERSLPDLAERVPRAALADAMAAFGASRSAEQREYTLRQMLPALANDERVELMRGFVAGPEPAAERARTIARAVLDERAWSAVERELVASTP